MRPNYVCVCVGARVCVRENETSTYREMVCTSSRESHDYVCVRGRAHLHIHTRVYVKFLLSSPPPR